MSNTDQCEAQADSVPASVLSMPDPDWEAKMAREESSRRRADIVPQIIGFIGVGWTVDDAIALGERLAKFVEGADGNAA